jgi:hypothetical protein
MERLYLDGHHAPLSVLLTFSPARSFRNRLRSGPRSRRRLHRPDPEVPRYRSKSNKNKNEALFTQGVQDIDHLPVSFLGT